MALVEAVLTYRPHAIGGEHPMPIGATADSRILRLLRDQLLAASRDEAAFWRSIEPGVAVLKMAEAERLGRVLAVLLPDDALQPDLRLVRSEDAPPMPLAAVDNPRALALAEALLDATGGNDALAHGAVDVIVARREMRP
jgi:hypothetical protein